MWIVEEIIPNGQFPGIRTFRIGHSESPVALEVRAVKAETKATDNTKFYNGQISDALLQLNARLATHRTDQHLV